MHACARVCTRIACSCTPVHAPHDRGKEQSSSPRRCSTPVRLLAPLCPPAACSYIHISPLSPPPSTSLVLSQRFLESPSLSLVFSNFGSCFNLSFISLKRQFRCLISRHQPEKDPFALRPLFRAAALGVCGCFRACKTHASPRPRGYAASCSAVLLDAYIPGHVYARLWKKTCLLFWLCLNHAPEQPHNSTWGQ